MAFDSDRILAETFVARVEYHPTIGSTNDRAAQCAGKGAGLLPLLVVADEQTAGRGRGTNRWWTGPGALAFSLVVDGQMVGAAHERSPLVTLAAAVAVVDTVAPLLPGHAVGLHWPNDVIAAGRKLAGILIEVLPDRRHVIGIGLNANNSMAEAPSELQDTAITLRDISERTHDRMDLLVMLLNRLDAEFSRLRSEPKTVAARANALCLQRGQLLTLQWGECTITGRCGGIGGDGAILLETPAGVQPFYSGTLLRQP